MQRIPFDKKEVENFTLIPATFPGWPDAKVFDYPISPKENYRMVYERKIPVWLPNRNDSRMITPRIDNDNLARVFAFEAQPLTDEDREGNVPRPDKFGIPWVYVEQVGGSMVEPGNPTLEDANDWQDVINFPDVASWDWAGSAEINKDFANTDRWFVYCHLTGFFERLISFMDFEGAAIALVDPDQKEATHSLLDALADCYIEIFTNAYNAYPFDSLNFHDDWGAQRAPFYSLDVAMEMLVPHIKKVTDFVHNDLGVFFDFHSCGKN
ncbi:MAG: methyltransferase, partial [Coriobacteriia bacterium]|nr:methyltransferase [Coriobacteriia bacterium]